MPTRRGYKLIVSALLKRQKRLRRQGLVRLANLIRQTIRDCLKRAKKQKGYDYSFEKEK